MQPVNQSNSEKKTTHASAQAMGGKGGTVAFASAAMQRKMNESGTEEPLTAHTGSHSMQTEPFNPATAPGTVQRIPTGDYADDYPAGDGMYWDTFDSEDHNGALVPSEVVAVMRNPGYGGVPSVDPPGWAWLKTKFGKLKGTWVRFHIINAELGGPGDDTDNLVPTLHALNHNGGWRTLEDNAKESATDEDDENDSTWTYVEVDLGYDDDYPAGIPATIDARWGYENDNGDWVQSGGNVHLAQNDPDDGDNNNYLPAAQITQGRLQELGCTLYEAQTLKGLIDAQYDDQDDFEQTAAQEEADDRIGMGGWYDVLNRIYVDEDDDIDGPYGIVVRNS